MVSARIDSELRVTSSALGTVSFLTCVGSVDPAAPRVLAARLADELASRPSGLIVDIHAVGVRPRRLVDALTAASRQGYRQGCSYAVVSTDQALLNEFLERGVAAYPSTGAALSELAFDTHWRR